jgi:hypothetical protein
VLLATRTKSLVIPAVSRLTRWMLLASHGWLSPAIGAG